MMGASIAKHGLAGCSQSLGFARHGLFEGNVGVGDDFFARLEMVCRYSGAWCASVACVLMQVVELEWKVQRFLIQGTWKLETKKATKMAYSYTSVGWLVTGGR